MGNLRKFDRANLVAEAGFTLVEVMVAAALIAGLALALSSIMVNISKGQRQMEAMSNAKDLDLLVTSNIRDKAGCSYALGIPAGSTQFNGGDAATWTYSSFPTSPNTPNNTQIYDSTDTVILQPGTKFGSASGSQLLIQSIIFQLSSNTPAAFNDGFFQVTYAGLYASAATVGAAPAIKTYPVKVYVDATGNKIPFCFSQDQNISYVCGYNGGTFNPANGTCSKLDLGSPLLHEACLGAGCQAAPAPTGPAICLNGRCSTVLPNGQNCPNDVLNPTFVHVVGFDSNGKVICGP